MPHTKIRSKRSIRNTVLFWLCFIYIFIIGLFDNGEMRDIIYYVVIAAIYFSAVLVIADKNYRFFYIAVVLVVLDVVTVLFDLENFSSRNFPGFFIVLPFCYL